MNTRSVPKRIEEFKLNFSVFDLSIVSETRSTSEVESLYKVPTYDMHCNSRNAQGRGVVLYIKSHLNSERIQDLNPTLPCKKSVLVKFSTNGKTT